MIIYSNPLGSPMHTLQFLLLFLIYKRIGGIDAFDFSAVKFLIPWIYSHLTEIQGFRACHHCAGWS